VDGADQWEAGASVAASSAHVQDPTILVCRRYEKKKDKHLMYSVSLFFFSSFFRMEYALFRKNEIFKDDKSFVAVFIRRRNKKKECSSSFLNENQA